MLGVGRFQIEIDIDDTAVSPRIEAWAEVDDVQEAPMGIVKHKKESIQVASSGELVYKLDTEKGDSYQGLYFFETADGDISRIKLEWDGVKMRDTSRQAYNAEIRITSYNVCYTKLLRGYTLSFSSGLIIPTICRKSAAFSSAADLSIF